MCMSEVWSTWNVIIRQIRNKLEKIERKTKHEILPKKLWNVSLKSTAEVAFNMVRKLETEASNLHHSRCKPVICAGAELSQWPPWEQAWARNLLVTRPSPVTSAGTGLRLRHLRKQAQACYLCWKRPESGTYAGAGPSQHPSWEHGSRTKSGTSTGTDPRPLQEQVWGSDLWGREQA